MPSIINLVIWIDSYPVNRIGSYHVNIITSTIKLIIGTFLIKMSEMPLASFKKVAGHSQDQSTLHEGKPFGPKQESALVAPESAYIQKFHLQKFVRTKSVITPKSTEILNDIQYTS
ncbi:MAG: hypothetical protein ACSHX0_07970 [Akkermansiaceae bacterium]